MAPTCPIPPSRCILKERSPIWQAFGSTPCTDVIGGTCDSITQGKVLFLACEDPRHLLCSLGAQPRVGSMDVVMNDTDPQNMARTALLLLLCAELDPSKQHDMDFLWAVWCNALWDPGTWQRLKPFITRLAASSVPWLQPGRPEDRVTLSLVYEWWLNERHTQRPTPSQMMNWRSHHRSQFMGHKVVNHTGTTDHSDPAELETTLAALATYEVFDFSSHHLLCQDKDPLLTHVCMDIALFNTTATLTRTGPRLMHDAAERKDKLLVNITLLEMDTGMWRCHYDSLPFRAWQPFTTEEMRSHMAKNGSRSFGLLCRACTARMSMVVAAFQLHTELQTVVNPSSNGRHAVGPQFGGPPGKVKLRVQLWCMDPLQLCLTEQLTGWASTTNSTTSTDSKSASVTLFDVIDTGSLGDRVGLLPLLVCAAPRLVQRPGARLRTESHTWGYVAHTMRDYLCEHALGVPQQLFPTILGLRLTTDLDAGPPQPIPSNTWTYSHGSTHRCLEWAPAGQLSGTAHPHPAPRPQLTLPGPTTRPGGGPSLPDRPGKKGRGDGSGGGDEDGDGSGVGDALLGALMRVARKCCVTDFSQAALVRDRSGLTYATPHVLACLLASCIQRIDFQLPSRSPAAASPPTAREPMKDAYTQLTAVRDGFSRLLDTPFRACFQSGLDLIRMSLTAAFNGVADYSKAGMMVELKGRLMMRPDRPTLFNHQPPLRLVLVPIEPMHLGMNKNQRGDWMLHQASQASEWTDRAMEGKAPLDGLQVVDVVDVQAISLGQQEDGEVNEVLNVTMHLPADAVKKLNPTATVAVMVDTVMAARGEAGITIPVPCLFEQKPATVTPSFARCLLPAARSPAPAPSSASATDNTFRLEVASLTEEPFSYTAVIKLTGGQATAAANGSSATTTPPGGAAGAAAADAPQMRGLSVKLIQAGPDGGPALCPSSHVVRVAVSQPVGVAPLDLVLRWPVAAGLGGAEVAAAGAYSSGCGVEAVMRRSAGLIELKLAKAQVWEPWPLDPPPSSHPPLLPLASLPPFTQIPSLPHHLNNMFTKKDLLYQLNLPPRGPYKLPTASHEFREGIKIFFTGALVDNDIVTRHAIYTSQQDVERNTPCMYVHLWPTAVRGPDGRPVLPAVVLDETLADELEVQGLKEARKLDRAQAFNRAIADPPDKPGRGPLTRPTDQINNYLCTHPDELMLLRRMFWRNAMACEPTAWQKSVLPTGFNNPTNNAWMATFVSPIYTEHTGTDERTDPFLAHLTGAQTPNSFAKKNPQYAPLLEPLCFKEHMTGLFSRHLPSHNLADICNPGPATGILRELSFAKEPAGSTGSQTGAAAPSTPPSQAKQPGPFNFTFGSQPDALAPGAMQGSPRKPAGAGKGTANGGAGTAGAGAGGKAGAGSAGAGAGGKAGAGTTTTTSSATTGNKGGSAFNLSFDSKPTAGSGTKGAGATGAGTKPGAGAGAGAGSQQAKKRSRGPGGDDDDDDMPPLVNASDSGSGGDDGDDDDSDDDDESEYETDDGEDDEEEEEESDDDLDDMPALVKIDKKGGGGTAGATGTAAGAAAAAAGRGGAGAGSGGAAQGGTKGSTKGSPFSLSFDKPKPAAGAATAAGSKAGAQSAGTKAGVPGGPRSSSASQAAKQKQAGSDDDDLPPLLDGSSSSSAGGSSDDEGDELPPLKRQTKAAAAPASAGAGKGAGAGAAKAGQAAGAAASSAAAKTGGASQGSKGGSGKGSGFGFKFPKPSTAAGGGAPGGGGPPDDDDDDEGPPPLTDLNSSSDEEDDLPALVKMAPKGGAKGAAASGAAGKGAGTGAGAAPTAAGSKKGSPFNLNLGAKPKPAATPTPVTPPVPAAPASKAPAPAPSTSKAAPTTTASKAPAPTTTASKAPPASSKPGSNTNGRKKTERELHEEARKLLVEAAEMFGIDPSGLL